MMEVMNYKFSLSIKELSLPNKVAGLFLNFMENWQRFFMSWIIEIRSS